MPPATRWVQIVDVNPLAMARHSPPITCPVTQVAASVAEWFPNAGAVRDTLYALQHALCAGGHGERLASLLNIAVQPAAPDSSGRLRPLPRR